MDSTALVAVCGNTHYWVDRKISRLDFASKIFEVGTANFTASIIIMGKRVHSPCWIAEGWQSRHEDVKSLRVQTRHHSFDYYNGEAGTLTMLDCRGLAIKARRREKSNCSN